MAETFQASRQWERISKEWVTAEASFDLTDFKSGRPNHKISLWDPGSNGVRYLKTMVHNLAATLQPADWARLHRTRNRDVGNPHAVRWEGETICLDYLQATLEAAFIERQVDLDGARVLEIGAGYGRSCHTLLSNHDLASYCVVDLPTTMRFSQRYLREVLDDAQFAKIEFVTVDEVEETLAGRGFDLALNIDSFAEMFPETARGYLRLIDRGCAAFYTKNPVGKYLDASLDGRSGDDDELLRAAMETGLLRQVLDVHDSDAVRAAAPGFVEAYRPGAGWECAADGWAAPWSFYWQAVYRDNGTGAPAAEGRGTPGAAP